jgi:hydroxymethylbilane synthase
MKDVETNRPAEIIIAAMLPRVDVRDRLIGAPSIAALPEARPSAPARRAVARSFCGCGRTSGSSSSAAMSTRGSPSWRRAKADATLLAAAGLERLDRPDVGTPIGIDILLPAPAQGAVGIEARTADADTRALLAALDHAPTHRRVLAERALLAALHADCHSPVAALAEEDGSMRAELFAEDGSAHVTGSGDDPGGARPRSARARARQHPLPVRRLS